MSIEGDPVLRRRGLPRRSSGRKMFWQRHGRLETGGELTTACERLSEESWTEEDSQKVDGLARSLGVKTRTYIKVDRPSSVEEDDPDFYPEEGRDVPEGVVRIQLARARASQREIWKIWERTDLDLAKSVIVINLMRTLGEVNNPAERYHPESRAIVKETLLMLGLPAIPFLEKLNSETVKQIIWEIRKTEVEVWKDEDRREVEG